MKILFITNIPSPYRVDFFNELSKYCSLTVVFENDFVNYRERQWIKDKGFNFESLFLNKSNIEKFRIKQLKTLIDNGEFDLIVIGCYSTIVGMATIRYLKRKKIDFIISADGGIIKKDESKIMYKLKKYLIGSAKYWFSTGKNTNEYLKYYGADLSNIYIYPFSSIREKSIKERINNNEIKKLKEKNNIREEKIILAVGRFIQVKGFDILIKMMNKLDGNIGVYIIGGKPTKEYLRIIEKYQLDNVHFVEFKEKNELEEYYRMANVFVLPTRGDVWGLVVNEAMAKGLPIVTTDKCVAGLELIENGKNGFIVPVDNEEELRKAIEKILNNKNLQEIMGKNNMEKIRYYTIENMAKIHVKIFENIISKGIN